MSIYAISDIHGCYDEFMSVLDKLSLNADDELYILGDAIDRGPASDKVIKWLVDNKVNSENSNIFYLLGNHEQMMIWSMEGNWGTLTVDMDNVSMWKPNGGNETLCQLSAALLNGTLSPEDLDEYQNIVMSAPVFAWIPTEEHGPVMLCHAGIQPPDDSSNIEEWYYQTEEELLWNRGQWYSSYKEPPFHVISGHIPTDVLAQWNLHNCPEEEYINGMLHIPMNWGKRHAIDCGSCFGGKVGALRVNDWKTFVSSPDRAW